MKGGLQRRLDRIEEDAGDREPIILVGDAPVQSGVGDRPVFRVFTGVPRAEDRR